MVKTTRSKVTKLRLKVDLSKKKTHFVKIIIKNIKEKSLFKKVENIHPFRNKEELKIF